MYRGAINCSVFACALLGVGRLLNSLCAPFSVPDFYGKVEFISAHREVDTLFIGSSRTLHHVIPTTFDAATAKQGTPTRSFCLGVAGARPPETYFMLRYALARTHGIKRVFIEVNRFEPHVCERTATSERFLHWHDFRHASLMLAHIAESRASLAEKWAQARPHLAALGYHQTSLGRGQAWVRSCLFPVKKARPVPASWIDTMGYSEPQSIALEGKKLADFSAGLLGLRKGGRISPLPRTATQALAATVAEVRATGAEVFLFLPPTTDMRDWFNGDNIAAPLLSFLDADRFAELYDPLLRNDYEHLNAAGAKRFTEVLAQEFLRVAAKPK